MSTPFLFVLLLSVLVVAESANNLRALNAYTTGTKCKYGHKNPPSESPSDTTDVYSSSASSSAPQEATSSTSETPSAAAPQVAKPSKQDNEICVYLKPNFQGEKLCFKAGKRINLCRFGGGCDGLYNDKVKSLKFGANIDSVHIYQHGNSTGFEFTISESTKAFPQDKSDFTTLYIRKKIPDNQACIYRGDHFTGERKCFKPNKTKTISLCDAKYGGCSGKWNDKVKSIQLGKTVWLQGYQHYWGDGDKFVYKTSPEKIRNPQLQMTDFRVFSK